MSNSTFLVRSILLAGAAGVATAAMVIPFHPAWAGATPPCVDGNGAGSIECGTNSNAGTFAEASAIGADTVASGAFGATAIGESADALGSWSTAVGSDAQATATDAVALGDNAQATGTDSTALGTDTTALSARSTAVGYDANAAIDGVALGNTANASLGNAISIGSASDATGISSVALGGNGLDGDALGAQATADRALALGADATASGTNSAAIGYDTNATGNNSVAIGFKTSAAASGTAIGGGSVATGNNSSAIGRFANALGGSSTAIGLSSNASATRAIAIGAGAQATGDRSTAIGDNANASLDNSTAIGRNATTTAANQVSIGGTGSSVRIGDINASTAAQVGPVNAVTIDSSGTLGKGAVLTTSQFAAAQRELAQALAVSDAQFNALSGQVGTLFDITRSQDRRIDRANEGVAMALAMQTASLQPDSNFGMAGGVGYYEDRSAATMSVIGRIGAKSFLTAGVGVGFNSGSVGARGGFQVEW